MGIVTLAASYTPMLSAIDSGGNRLSTDFTDFTDNWWTVTICRCASGAWAAVHKVDCGDDSADLCAAIE